MIANKNGTEATSYILQKHPQLLDRNIVSFAALFGFPSTLQAVISCGADIQKQNPHSQTAVELSSSYTRPERLENLRLLLTYEKGPSDTETCARLGNALSLSCRAGNLVAIQLIL